jgi:hypothetical protein
MWASPEGALKIVVPTQMEDSIMWLHHEHPLAGHPGANKMAEAIRTTFYFKHLKKKCKKWTNNCQCKRAKARMRNKAGLTLTRPIPQIFAWLIIDIVGPFPRSRNGKVFWLTMIDAFSKDLELVALGAKTAEGVAKAILELWICRRGCPSMHDNAREFTGKVVSSLCELLAIQQKTVTAYHHPSAGLVERVHSYAESIMKSSQPTRLSAWDQFLPYIRFSILTHEVDFSSTC